MITANRGLSLTRVNINPLTTYDNYVSSNNNVNNFSKDYGVATIEEGIQTVKITAVYSGYTPSLVYIKKYIPPRFIIDVDDLPSLK